MSGRVVAAIAGYSPARALETIRGGAETKLALVQLRVIPGHNPRGYVTGDVYFEGPEFDKLVESIRQYGDVLQPVLVRRTGDGVHFEICAGERRFRASQKAGLQQISAVIRSISDDELPLVALAENEVRLELAKIDKVFYLLDQVCKRADVQRDDLRRVMIRLRKADAAPEPDSVEGRVAAAVAALGLPSYSTLVRSWTRYLELTEAEIQALKTGVAEDVVLALLDVPDRDQRADLLRRAVEEQWSAADAVQAVRELAGTAAFDARVHETVRDIRAMLTPRAVKKLGADRAEALRAELEAVVRRYREEPSAQE